MRSAVRTTRSPTRDRNTRRTRPSLGSVRSPGALRVRAACRLFPGPSLPDLQRRPLPAGREARTPRRRRTPPEPTRHRKSPRALARRRHAARPLPPPKSQRHDFVGARRPLGRLVGQPGGLEPLAPLAHAGERLRPRTVGACHVGESATRFLKCIVRRPNADHPGPHHAHPCFCPVHVARDRRGKGQCRNQKGHCVVRLRARVRAVSVLAFWSTTSRTPPTQYCWGRAGCGARIPHRRV